MMNANKQRDKFIKLVGDMDLSQEEFEAQANALLGPAEWAEYCGDCGAYYDRVDLEWKSLQDAEAMLSIPVSKSFAAKARANPDAVIVMVRVDGVTTVERPGLLGRQEEAGE